jgi:hypothetical protein
MNEHAYDDPVAQLLTLGDPRGEAGWPEYTALGLTDEDVPALIRMALDEDLNHRGPESDEVWAPLHAWRALGQLRAMEAAEPLLALFDELDNGGDDWITLELPKVYSMLGPDTIPILREHLADTDRGPWSRAGAVDSLVHIAQQYPDVRDEVIAILSAQLEHFEEQHRRFNASIAAGLAYNLRAVEAAPVLERAYAADAVDLMMQGDWEDVQIHLGLLDERRTPQPDYTSIEMPEYAKALEALKPHPERLLIPSKPEQTPGRNDPCWCDSGKKYKHCHWRADQLEA